ncbi:hypothetical protein DW022_15305 [Ruminococcus sp. AF37-6AT]|jgi:predicted transcriptional regulator|nr:hypothetical protein DW098_15585 [Ruminococcus sp. AM07-21]RHL43865.1 hypothetical protein DW022_15305 [Ruminococcus sp. AF37-6AT]RHP54729.1 hypothetical protein DWZ27_13280 [Ruminococcus sp. AF31-16BH]
MQNEIWDQIGNFLNSLRCENVERKSYIRFSELREAEKLNKEAQMKYAIEVNKLDAEHSKNIKGYVEALQHLAFMAEEQAYCQGYVDCIQLLAGIGMLKENPEIEKIVEKLKN